MIDYSVRHHYRYEYSAPIRDVRQKLIMIPPDTYADQRLLEFDLEVRGTSGQLLVEWQADRFGNRVCRVEAERVESTLEFDACFRVRRAQHVSIIPRQETETYTRFTALTMPDTRIRGAAQQIAQQATSVEHQAHLAHEWAASSIEYALGVTGTQTPAAMALHLGQGVCQDYAHIMLSLLRSLEIPCRYISGHLLGEGAPHAWVEALLPTSHDDQWQIVAYDPTHRRHATADYIVVATGGDFADVTSTSGVFTGGAVGKLQWSKQASRT